MPQIVLETSKKDGILEADRLAALHVTGILDTEPEAIYDTLTRLTAEYFQADVVVLGFGDETRLWAKSAGASKFARFRGKTRFLIWFLPKTALSLSPMSDCIRK